MNQFVCSVKDPRSVVNVLRNCWHGSFNPYSIKNLVSKSSLIHFLYCSLGENAITQKIAEEEERKQLQREQETTWYHEGKISNSILIYTNSLSIQKE